MGFFIVQRIAYGLIVVFGVSTIVFVLLHLTGDPARLMSPPDASPEAIAQLRSDLGFDRSIWIQYFDFLSHAARGDFGDSIRYHQPAMDMVLSRLGATVRLAMAALSVALIIAIPVGTLSAMKRGSSVDLVGMSMALFGQSVPTFWLGLMLIMVFSLRLGWLPPSGDRGISSLILPAITLGAYSAASITRILRSSLIEVGESDYIRTARAKGVSEPLILIRHAMRNASLPVITVIGLQVGNLLGGAVITEYIFNYPGIGRLVLQAIGNRDFAMVQAFVVIVAVTVVVVNLLVDMSYFILDPRIKAGAA